MAINTSIRKPDWLTDEKIQKYKKIIADCKNPMTESEVEQLDIEFDATYDFTRYDAYKAKKILEKYGIPFETA